MPRIALPLQARFHGYAHRRGLRFHAEYSQAGRLVFQWGREIALWDRVRVENEVVDVSQRRFSLYVDGVERQTFTYRRYKPSETESGGFPAEEVDRDYYLTLASRPEHWQEKATAAYGLGWSVGSAAD